MTHAYTAHAVYAFARVITDIGVIVQFGKLALDLVSGTRMLCMGHIIAVAQILQLTGTVCGTAHAVKVVI